MKLLLQPHNDDAVLFAAYTLLREKPYVVTVLRSYVQSVDYPTREAEDCCAMAELGCEFPDQWRYRDDAPDWDAVDRALRQGPDYDLVYAPLPDAFGHEHHNHVARVADDVFGARVLYYATYRRGERRTRTETEVPFEPHWLALKLRAMACYESQITLESTRPWFDDWQREWYG